jgi:hypothetical protein
MAGWTVHDDGSFDLVVDGVRLIGCYPAIDGRPLRALAVTVERGGAAPSATYRLREGTLVLTFARDEESLVLKSSLRGMSSAPHWVLPIAGAHIEAAQLFKQGLGFGGPSGFFPLDARRDPWCLESYWVAGLVAADEGALAIGPYEHGRFLFKAAALNRVHRRGLVDRHVDRATASFECGFSTEGIPIAGELALPEIHLLAAPRAWDALRRWAMRTGRAMRARPSGPPSYHWCSWYRRGSNFTRRELDELLATLAQTRPAIPIQTVQIDAGYCPQLGDWLEPNELWPGGLEAAFAAIRAAGYRPGVWIGPFMVSCRSKLFREHPDWVIRGLDGKPVVEARNYDSARAPGWTEEETYALDPSHPDAVAWLRMVFRTLRGWGCRFFKTDFMDWGFKDQLTVMPRTPERTHVELYRSVLEAIREEIDDDSYWLGCIAPFGPFIGLADGMRVANDVAHLWQDGGIGNMLQETWADQYFNNVWWQNDPDVVFLRDRFIEMDDGEIRALAYWHGLLGGSINTSEFFQELPPERLKLWRFLEPGDRRWTATAVNWQRAKKLRVLAREYSGRQAWALVALNPARDAVTEAVRLREAIGVDDAYVFAWEPGRARPLGRLSTLTLEIAGHNAMLYYLSMQDEPPPPDLSLGGKQLANWVTGSTGR